MKTKEPNRKPVRRGVRYCSPACGRGCTITEHRRAKEEADALAARLGGKWKGAVWENMGWHGRAELGSLVSVSYHGPRKYWATTEEGAGIQQHHAYGTSPAAAVKKLYAMLHNTTARIGFTLSKIDGE